ncbi:MAG: hypothetical protein Fur0018_24280 [Anaerolineales bacterium]
MWHSLRTRLFLTYLVIVLIVLAVVGAGLFFYLLRNPLLDRQTFLRLDTAALALERRLNGLAAPPSERVIRTALQRTAENYNVRILVMSADGGLRLDTGAAESAPLSLSPRLLARKDGITRDANKQQWLFVVRTLPNDVSLVLAAPRPARLQAVRSAFGDELLTLFGRAASIALVIALLLAYAISRWVAAPLQRMSEAAQALAGGEISPVPIDGPQEVRVLGKSFNQMAHQVQTSRRAQQDFVANISHDLKTPLTSIQGFAQAILDGTAEAPEMRRQAAQVIYDEASRMHRMVLDLLELARFDAGMVRLEIAPLELRALLTSLTQKLAPLAAEKDIHLDMQADTPLPLIPADGDRLTRVFTNLLDNAIRHTPPGGAVTLSVSREPDKVVVCVEDTGSGIPPEALPRLFERFYQVERSRAGRTGRGSGLGLAIASEIVRAHGGGIRAANRAQGGACFEVCLPLTHDSQQTTAHRRTIA